jgi:8-oxo-dGTP pyrophosphatase MutT (NUDIX family)
MQARCLTPQGGSGKRWDTVIHPNDPLLAHIRRCQAPTRTGSLLWCGNAAIGRVHPTVEPALDALLIREPRGFSVPSGPAIEALGIRMAEIGLYRPHDELFDVLTGPDAAPLGRIDRGALPLLGLLAQGVHVNGLVERSDGLHLWIGRRSPHKRLDPGKLDHLVAGGMTAGLTPLEAVVKEACEEASLGADLSSSAVPASLLGYAVERPEGARRDLLHCFDLFLPEDFRPVPHDGEVVSFELLPIEQALALVRDTQDFKFNVNLVLIDLFLRRGLIGGDEAHTLRAALNDGLSMALEP